MTIRGEHAGVPTALPTTITTGALPLLGPPTDAAAVAAAAAAVAEDTTAASLPLPAPTVSAVTPSATAPTSSATVPVPVPAPTPVIDFSALSWRLLEEWKGEGCPGGRLSAPLPSYQEQTLPAVTGKRSLDAANSDRRTFVATHSLYSRVAGGSKTTPAPAVVSPPGTGAEAAAAAAGPGVGVGVGVGAGGVGTVGGIGGAKGNGTVAAAATVAAETGVLPVGLPGLPVSPLQVAGKVTAKRPRSSSAAERCVAVCVRGFWGVDRFAVPADMFATSDMSRVISFWHSMLLLVKLCQLCIRQILCSILVSMLSFCNLRVICLCGGRSLDDLGSFWVGWLWDCGLVEARLFDRYPTLCGRVSVVDCVFSTLRGSDIGGYNMIPEKKTPSRKWKLKTGDTKHDPRKENAS